MAKRVTAVTQAGFDAEVLGADRPVLVDFYADWCAPCKAIAPVVEELAETHAEHLDVRKVDVDRHPELARRFGVRGIPTLILFKDGAAVDTVVGAVGRPALETLIEGHAVV